MLKRVRHKAAGVLFSGAGIGGAFLGLVTFQLNEGHHRLAGLVVGWLYGVSVWGLMRLLAVGPRWSWLAGILAGPVPIALLLPDPTPASERGVILLGVPLGLLLGLLVVARAHRSANGAVPAVPSAHEAPRDAPL